MPLTPGQILNNRYRIVKLLGQGGMGAVYRVWDIHLSRPCAIKENTEASFESQRQFEREAQILAHLSHPNLPHVTDHFHLLGQGQYLVMEFVEGEDLLQLLQRTSEPLVEEQVLPWILQICDSLDYLHSQTPPIIHRDIKPANIKITTQGKVMLVDFGIAKVFDPNANTTKGARAITPGYSPQEQYGQGATDARTDVYALGATLYTLLTGQQPLESILRNLGEKLTPPSTLNASISTKTEQAILKAMEMLPGQRFQNIVEFKTALSYDHVPESTSLVSVEKTQIMASYESVQAPTRNSILPIKRLSLLIVIPLVILLGLFLGKTLFDNSGRMPYNIVATSTLVSKAPTPTPSRNYVITETVLATPSATISNTPTQTLGPSRVVSFPTPVVDSRGVSMALVPAGKFEMGIDAEIALEECQKTYLGGICERDWFADGEPAHIVYLDDFYIDLTEVTNTMYALCVNDGMCTLPTGDNSEKYAGYYGNPGYNDYPVIYVNWEQAKVYCSWRGARLPTEAEWEKAARGLEGKLYPWGDTFDGGGNLANFCDNNCSLDWFNPSINDGYADLSPAGSFPAGASSYEIMDMAGNVWEWVADWYGANFYSISPSQNPIGPSTGTFRVARGGSWRAIGGRLLSVGRYYGNPLGTYNSFGFRCARSP